LRALVIVIDRQGFTRAAEALNRTQSAVSMQVKRLEEAHGARLIERGRGGLRPTREGEALLGYARRLLALNDEAADALGRSKVMGRVRLGVMEDYARVRLPSLIARFSEAHSAVELEVETGLTAGMIDRLGRRYDLVLAMHPPRTTAGTLVRREQALWAAAAGRGPESLDPLPLALAPQGCLFRDWAIESLERAGRRWRLVYVSHSSASVEAAVAAGLAVTVVKAGTRLASLRPLGRRHGLPALPVAEIRLHRAPGLSPAADSFARFLEETLRGP
jgi:DNA-binding transcriptional LysR family regulator